MHPVIAAVAAVVALVSLLGFGTLSRCEVGCEHPPPWLIISFEAGFAITCSSFSVVLRPLSVVFFALFASGEAVGAVGVEVVAND